MYKRIVLTCVAVVGVVLIAVFFRFYDIQNYPPGLFPDEAANGEDALLILQGDWRPFYARGNGREALFFYLQAASIALFGIGVWQMHIVSSVVGTLTVLATYFGTRVWFGRLAGVLAALFLATSHWHVTLSRTGFRAILVPLFVALFTACIGQVVIAVGLSLRKGGENRMISQVKSYVFAVLAGLAFAAGLYTYLAFRVMLGVVVGMFLVLLFASLHPRVGMLYFKRYGGQIVAGLAAFLIAGIPLGVYFMEHPEDILGRAGQVSIFSPDLQHEIGEGTLAGTLAYTVETTLLSFFAGEGDLNWRHSVAGYPLLNPLVGVLLLLGVAWVLKGVSVLIMNIVRGKGLHLDGIFVYLLLLLSGMLLPAALSAQGLPHGLRSVGLIFPLFMLTGAAGAVVIRWLVRRFYDLGRSIAVGAALGLLVLGAAYDGALYFLVARATSEAHYFYRADLTAVAAFIMEYVREQPRDKRPLLVLDAFSLQTVHFLTHSLTGFASTPAPHDYQQHPDEAQHSYTALDPATSHLTALQPGEIIIFTQSTLPDADRYAATHRDSVELLVSRTDRFGSELMRVYRGVAEGSVEGIQEREGPATSDLDA